MKTQTLTQEVFAFMKEAGAFAIDAQSSATSEEKADRTIVTQTDLAITEQFKKAFNHHLKSSGHVLIDEESVDEFGSPADVLTQDTYQWVLDPIDGTKPYANGMDSYGISLGILKDGKPWFGAVYLPGKDELYIGAVGEGVACVTGVQTDAPTHKPLERSSLPVSRNGFVEVEHLAQQEFDWDNEVAQGYTPHSSVVAFADVAVGRAHGSVFYNKLWDVAGIWPIMKEMGVELFTVDGEHVEGVSTSLIGDDWNWRQPMIACLPEELEKVQSGLTPKQEVQL